VVVSLRISGLTHEYDAREVFAGLDFTFDGGCMSVTGPNGSGKSTLIKILAGLLTPVAGSVSISVDGSPVPREAVRGVVGVAAPDVRLYGELTVRENIEFLLRARGVGVHGGRIEEVLEEVGLRERAGDEVRELSTGLGQRACLACAILHRPPLLLLDEPCSNLDADGSAMVRDLISRYAEVGMVVLAANDPGEVALGSARLDLGARR
jgi:heme exporter protein A